MTPAELLEEAAEHVRKPGMWKRGGYGPSQRLDTPHCAVGWLYAVEWAKGERSDFSLLDSAMTAVREVLNISTVETWNDTMTRSGEEVANGFILTAKVLRDRGEQL